MLGPGAIDGELAIIDGGPRSASVFAVRDCELSFVSRAEFYQYLINVLATRLRQRGGGRRQLQARLARTLLELGKHVGQDDGAGHLVIRHKISQGDLAAMADVTRENVSRVISDWKRNKVITQSYPPGPHPLKVCIEGPRVREFFTHRSHLPTFERGDFDRAPMFGSADEWRRTSCYQLERGLLKVVVTSPRGDERILAPKVAIARQPESRNGSFNALAASSRNMICSQPRCACLSIDLTDRQNPPFAAVARGRYPSHAEVLRPTGSPRAAGQSVSLWTSAKPIPPRRGSVNCAAGRERECRNKLMTANSKTAVFRALYGTARALFSLLFRVWRAPCRARFPGGNLHWQAKLSLTVSRVIR
jgi:Crp-like helix-turn-helix domain/Cyclic nucleotide-binding domain